MTWTSLLYHYGQAGMLEEAKDVLMRMEDAGCRPNQATYTALIQAFMKAAR
jgi:pentatricopeptide repeat protein